MQSRLNRFNIIFLLVAAVLLPGCETTSAGKTAKGVKPALIRFHLETNPDGTPYTQVIRVVRGAPIQMSVYTLPFLNEQFVLEAAVVEAQPGVHAIQLQFDSRGSFNLENTTQANRGSRIAIAAEFGEARWLAAPRIEGAVRGGVFTFIPDCSREEADRIVAGLNLTRKQARRNEHFSEEAPKVGGTVKP